MLFSGVEAPLPLISSLPLLAALYRRHCARVCESQSVLGQPPASRSTKAADLQSASRSRSQTLSDAKQRENSDNRRTFGADRVERPATEAATLGGPQGRDGNPCRNVGRAGCGEAARKEGVREGGTAVRVRTSTLTAGNRSTPKSSALSTPTSIGRREKGAADQARKGPRVAGGSDGASDPFSWLMYDGLCAGCAAAGPGARRFTGSHPI